MRIMLVVLILPLSVLSQTTTTTTTFGPTTTTTSGPTTTTTSGLTTGSSGTTVSTGPISCTSTCQVGGTWGPWNVVAPLYNTTSCSDTCGACGTVNRTRVCQSAASGCPCSGYASQIVPCNIQPCSYPRNSCCNGLTASSLMLGGQGMIICAPEPSIYTPVPLVSGCMPSGCCPPEGVWSTWSDYSLCNSTCGGCGLQVRSRICMTESQGCPCSGSNIGSQPCAFGTPCTYPMNSCCGSFVAMVNASNQVVCGPQPSETDTPPGPLNCTAPACPPGGLWSTWISTSCSDSCGMCGTGNYTRTCLGGTSCPCTGSTTMTDACGTSLCPFPRSTCCTGFTRTPSNGTFVCASNSSTTLSAGTGTTTTTPIGSGSSSASTQTTTGVSGTTMTTTTAPMG